MGPRCPSCGRRHELSIGELEERVYSPKFFFCERCLSLFVVPPDEIARYQAVYRASAKLEAARERADPRVADIEHLLRPSRRPGRGRAPADAGNSELARRFGAALRDWLAGRARPDALAFELADGSRLDLAAAPGALLLLGSARSPDCPRALRQAGRLSADLGLRLLWIPLDHRRAGRVAQALAERAGLAADGRAVACGALGRALAGRLGARWGLRELPTVLVHLDASGAVGWIGPYPPAR